MRYKKGDKVKFLNDTGKGIVIGYIDDKTINVEREDGFEIPVSIKELISINSVVAYNNDRMDKVIEEKIIINDNRIEKKAETEAKVSGKVEESSYDKEFIPRKGTILLAFVPVNIDIVHNSKISLYLINDCNYEILFTISSLTGTKWYLLQSGKLEADTKMFIDTFDQTELSKMNKVLLQFIQYKPGEYQVKSPVNFEFDMRNVSLYKKQYFKENEYFETNAFLINSSVQEFEDHIHTLSEQQIKDVIAEKEKEELSELQIVKNKNRKNDIEEVDLHIHTLVENDSGLTDGEKLKIQLDTFYTRLEESIKMKLKRVVFIHGVGNGTLKYEIRKALDEKYPKLIYQDASFEEYGYGATLVNIK